MRFSAGPFLVLNSVIGVRLRPDLWHRQGGMRPRSHRVLFLAGQCRAHSMEPGGKRGRPRACQTPTEWPNPFSDPDTVPVTPERLSGLRLGLCPSGLVGLMSGRLGGRIAFSIYGKAFSQGAPGVLDTFLWPPRSDLLPTPRPSCWAYLGGQPYCLPPGGRQWAARAGARREESEAQGQVGLAASGPGVTAPLSPLLPLRHSGLFRCLASPRGAWHSPRAFLHPT